MLNSTRVLGIALAMLIGLGVLNGTAQAQTMMTVYDFNNIEAWWESFECSEKLTLLDLEDNHTGRTAGCRPFNELGPNRKSSIRASLENLDVHNYTNHPSVMAWWDAQVSCTESNIKNVLVGMGAVAGAGKADSSSTTSMYCKVFNNLGADARARVEKSGMALSGMMPTPTPTPALPVVGVGILGLLLAGRGMWLRRSRA